MEALSKKYGSLKAWQWVAVIGAAGFIYFRLRSGGSSAATDPLASGASGNTDPTAGAQGFGEGYQQGYDSGMYQGQVAPIPPTVPPGSQNCRTMKDPNGKTHTVCGSGSFVKLPGATSYRWVEGAKRTIYGYGKKGNPFYRPHTTKAIHNPGGKPVRKGYPQQPYQPL
jgi:hypothetical protein